jgi:hypothetical protein
MTWMTANRIGDGLALVAGFVLIAVAFLATLPATGYWNALVTGTLIALASALALWKNAEGLDWARLVFGTWAVLSPWVLALELPLGLALAHVAAGTVALAWPTWRRWKDESPTGQKAA